MNVLLQLYANLHRKSFLCFIGEKTVFLRFPNITNEPNFLLYTNNLTRWFLAFSPLFFGFFIQNIGFFTINIGLSDHQLVNLIRICRASLQVRLTRSNNRSDLPSVKRGLRVVSV